MAGWRNIAKRRFYVHLFISKNEDLKLSSTGSNSPPEKELTESVNTYQLTQFTISEDSGTFEIHPLFESLRWGIKLFGSWISENVQKLYLLDFSQRVAWFY